MKIEQYNIEELFAKAKKAMADDATLSASMRVIIETLLIVISILVQRLSLNSSNSSKPPASDANRAKKSKSPIDPDKKKKPGGQVGHEGKNLSQVEHPDEIIKIDVDLKALPKGNYKEVGIESRQVVNLIIKRHITQYDAQIVENEAGKQFRAPFPEEAKRPIQYGNTVKAHAVYMSCFQMLPYERMRDYFENQLSFAISAGTLCNFVEEAYDLLIDCGFDKRLNDELMQAQEIGVDETGVNINGKRQWIHTHANDQWTLFYVHQSRGSEAMNAKGILPNFKGVMIHDHWYPYFNYKDCEHALCNAHHLRELTFVEEVLQKDWAKHMRELLIEIKLVVEASEKQALEHEVAEAFRIRYRKILEGGLLQSPAILRKEGQKRGKIAQSKDHNLLIRLRDFETETLRFMTNELVPFTNNRSEQRLRMIKVQQKISGCFRSIDGAEK